MLERDYKELMAQVTPCAALRTQTAERMAEEERKRTAAPRARGTKRLAAAALACVLVLAVSMTALAAFPGFRELLFGENSPVGESLTPVTTVSEKDGLRLEVLGAMSDKSNVIVYFTLQDTEGENRLGSDMYLSVFAKLNGEYPEEAWEKTQDNGKNDYASVLDYDPETQTAFCRYEMTTGEKHDVTGAAGEEYDATGASVQLWLDRIWYQTRSEFTTLELSGVPLTGETLPVAYYQTWFTALNDQGEQYMKKDGLLPPAPDGEATGLFNDFRGNFDENGRPVVLKPGEPLLETEDGSAAVTAVGLLDGKLHIQTRDQAWSKGDLNGTVCFADVRLAPLGEGQALEKELEEHQIGRWVDPELMEKLDRFSSGYGNHFTIDEEGQVIWNAYAMIDAGETYYTEAIFEIGSAEELAQYDCLVEFRENKGMTIDLRTEEFSTVGELAKSTASYHDLQAGDIAIDTLDITALGVYASGWNSDMKKIKTLELVCGGESFPYSISYNNNYEREDMSFTMKFISDGVPVEPEAVTAVRINGEEIPLS